MSKADSNKLTITQENDDFQKLCQSLLRTSEVIRHNEVSVSQMRVLTYIGMGLSLAASFLSPRAGLTIGNSLYKSMTYKDRKEWKKYNAGYLRQTLRRLENQKLIERSLIDGEEVLIITNKGKTKILHSALENTKIKTGNWDGKWRIVIYDIEVAKKYDQERARKTFKQMGFYQMQRSVYLFPYPCSNEVEYIRSYFDLGKNIQYIIAQRIENDYPYREYFGLV